MADNIEVAFGPLKKFTADKVKKLITNAIANLAETTPVDTGHAANNWVPSVTAPYTGVDGSRDSPTGTAQAAGLSQVLSDYDLPQTAWISNNVPYIGSLNDGHSQQAPVGFVQAAILKAVREVASQ